MINAWLICKSNLLQIKLLVLFELKLLNFVWIWFHWSDRHSSIRLHICLALFVRCWEGEPHKERLTKGVAIFPWKCPCHIPLTGTGTYGTVSVRFLEAEISVPSWSVLSSFFGFCCSIVYTALCHPFLRLTLLLVEPWPETQILPSWSLTLYF